MIKLISGSSSLVCLPIHPLLHLPNPLTIHPANYLLSNFLIIHLLAHIHHASIYHCDSCVIYLSIHLYSIHQCIICLSIHHHPSIHPSSAHQSVIYLPIHHLPIHPSPVFQSFLYLYKICLICLSRQIWLPSGHVQLSRWDFSLSSAMGSGEEMIGTRCVHHME